MPNRHLRTGAPPSTSGDDERRRGKGAIALLALGAPFVAATPAVAAGGVAGQPGNGHAEEQASAQASSDASAGGGSGAAAQGGGNAAHGNSADQSAAGTGAQGDVETSDDGAGAGTPSAGAGGHAKVHGGAHDSGGAHAEVHGGGHAGGAAHAEVHGGGHAGGSGHAEVSGGAKAGGTVDERTDGRDEDRGTSVSHGSGAAKAANTRAHARHDSRERADVAGEPGGEENLRVESRAHGNGHSGGSTHARARVNERGAARSSMASDGDRGFTHVRVTSQQDDRAGGRVSASVKASPALDAAIRAEAREAARAEIRARYPRLEAGQVAARFAVKRRFEGRGVQRRRTTADNHAEALLRILETAWTTGGPAKANALLELCLGRPASAAQARGEGRETGQALFGTTRARGVGTVQLAPGRPEGTNGGGVPGTPTSNVEAPSAPLTAKPMAGSDLLPSTEGAIEAPREAGSPRQPRGPASRPGATQPSDFATGPRATTGPAAPSGVRVTREAGVAVQQRQLPFTGAELPLVIIAGAAALAAGALLRRSTQGAVR